MFKIVKNSFTYKRGTIDGRHTTTLKEYRKSYKTEKAAKMILTKLGFRSENMVYDLPDGFTNVVAWVVVKEEIA